MLETGKKFRVRQEDGISDCGIEAINTYLLGKFHVGLPSWFSRKWDDVQYDPEGDYKFSGKPSTRIDAYMYKVHGVKLDGKHKEEIGNLASWYYVESGKDIVYDFTRKFSWKAGQFGDLGSCFWNNGTPDRHAMEHAGGYAIRFYHWADEDSGIGRAWVFPHLGPEVDSYVVFNSYMLDNASRTYRRGSTNLRFMADVLAAHMGVKNGKQVSMDDVSEIYINSNIGILVQDDSLPTVEYPRFNLDVGHICCGCHLWRPTIDESWTILSGGYRVCADCVDDHSVKCPYCGIRCYHYKNAQCYCYYCGRLFGG